MGDNMAGKDNGNGVKDTRKVLFFDIDNCLYPRSTKVYDQMANLIDQFFATHLSLSKEDAIRLHKEYFQSYGLAIEGLVRHHKVDALEYNAKVDDALPLEGIIKPNPDLRRMLEAIDRTKVKPWLFTNAYVNHGRRVVKLLGIEDLFESITYCDYGADTLLCKPARAMFEKAMREAGVERVEDCYFVDDSYINCKAAQELGWSTAHLVEEGLKQPKTPASKYQIENIVDVQKIFPDLFVPKHGATTA